MNSKFTLAVIALVGIGVFALPSTMALFAGQHSFYNIDATGNQVPCTKCHGDVKAELSSGGSSVTGTKGPHADFKCEYCHRAEAGMSSGDNAYAKITYSGLAPGNGSIYLVTTIRNFESGNFPKSISYVANISVDNWNGNVFNLDGTPFLNQTQLNDDNNLYAGSLSGLSSGATATVFNYSYASETSTYNVGNSTVPGTPKDTNSTTQNYAFNPRAVTWSGTKENLNGSGSREVTPGTTYHAASLVSCLECHGGEQEKGAKGFEIATAEPYNHAGWLIDASDPTSTCSNCHYSTASHTPAFEHALEAGGFGLTSAPNDTGSIEAHNDFVKGPGTAAPGSVGAGVLRAGYGAGNDACVACHTHVAVDINFQKRYAMKFDAYAPMASGGNWTVGGFSAQGNVLVEEFGNGTGGAIATSDHNYTGWGPGQTMYIVNSNGSQGAQVVGLGTGSQLDTTDHQSALTTP